MNIPSLEAVARYYDKEKLPRPKLAQRFRFLQAPLRVFLGASIAMSGALYKADRPVNAAGTIPSDATCEERAQISQEALDFVFNPDGQTGGAASITEQKSLMDPAGVRGQAEKVVSPEEEILPQPWPFDMMAVQTNRKIPEPVVITTTQTITDENGITSVETYTQTKPIRIVVIDSGLNSGLEQFRAAIEKKLINPWYDFIDQDCDPDDKYGHGTFVTGEKMSNDPRISIIEVNDETDPTKIPVEIYVIRALDEYNQGSWHDIIKAMLMAEKIDADLVNMSLGGNADDPVLMGQLVRTIQYLREHGTHVIAAAGNWPNVPKFMPGCADGVPNTTALDQAYKVFVINNNACNNKPNSPESFAGPGVKVFGVNYQDGKIMEMSGTSMVVPWLTTLVALEMAHGIDFAEALKVVLLRVKVPEDWSQELGRGIFQYDLPDKTAVADPEPVDISRVFLPLIYSFTDYSSEKPLP